MAEVDLPAAGLIALERTLAVQDAMLTLLQTSETQVQQLEQQAATRQHAVDTCLASCLAAVQAAYLSREEHQDDLLQSSSWQPDRQPQACCLDSWVRGALEVRQPRKITATPPPDEGRSSRQGARPANPGSRAPSVRGPAGPGSVVSSQGGRVRRQASEATSHQRTVPVLVKTASRQELEDRLREEVDIRRKFQQKTLEQQQVQEAERKRLEELHKALRGKEYSYDCKGQIIVMAAVDADSLPPTATMPAITIVGPEEAAAKASSRVVKSKPGDKGGGDSSSRGKAKVSLAGSLPDYIEERKETQPPILDTMKPSPGVTVKQGAQVKKGPRPSSTLDHMTRQAFAAYVAKTSRLGATALARSASSAALAPAAPAPGASPASAPAAQASPAMPEAPTNFAEAGPAGFSMGAALRVTSDDPARPSWAKGGVHRSVLSPARATDTDEAVNMANMALTSASDWGVNTANKRYDPSVPLKAATGKAAEPFLPLRQRSAPRPTTLQRTGQR